MTVAYHVKKTKNLRRRMLALFFDFV